MSSIKEKIKTCDQNSKYALKLCIRPQIFRNIKVFKWFEKWTPNELSLDRVIFDTIGSKWKYVAQTCLCAWGGLLDD
jgi:hypothetical protein